MILLQRQFGIFILGGSLSAFVDIGLLQILVYNSTPVFIATTAAFVAGLCVNYAFHAKVTFKNVTNLATLGRFLCLVFINYLITLAFVAVSVALFDMVLIGKIISLPVVAVNGFFIGKHWVFK